MDKKLIPYSVYLPADYVKKLKVLAKERKASELIRNAVMMIIDAHDAYTAGYNQGIEDAIQVVIYDCPEAQMVAVQGQRLGRPLKRANWRTQGMSKQDIFDPSFAEDASAYRVKVMVKNNLLLSAIEAGRLQIGGCIF
jgi:hypothetical protein